MKSRIIRVFMAVICSLFTVGCSMPAVESSQADQKDHRALANELAEISSPPPESMIEPALAAAKIGVVGVFDGNMKTRLFAPILEKALLEVIEDLMRDPQTIQEFRNMQVDLFMETYTESEIRELIKFYRTPVGEKTAKKMPEIMQKGMERGAAYGQTLFNSPKFGMMWNDKINQLKQEGKLPENIGK